jgi:hypothetical protein
MYHSKDATLAQPSSLLCLVFSRASITRTGSSGAVDGQLKRDAELLGWGLLGRTELDRELWQSVTVGTAFYG